MDIDKQCHTKFLKRSLDILPDFLSSFDTQRMTVSLFCIVGMDILDSLESLNKEEIVEWILALQCDSSGGSHAWGFRGSNSTKIAPECIYDEGHLAQTYAAIASLLTLGDDLSRVNRSAIIRGLKSLQQKSGCFQASYGSLECDMRFLYCACCICTMLNSWEGMDVDLASSYILRCITYEGGFSFEPNLEAHGGSTFCALASLHLMGKFSSNHSKPEAVSVLNSRQVARLLRWLFQRQDQGFNGRPGKADDTCYSFWIGASLQLLNSFSSYVDESVLINFMKSAECDLVGGFGKYPGSPPDVLHAFLSLSGLSFTNSECLRSMCPALNITTRALHHLETLHNSSS